MSWLLRRLAAWRRESKGIWYVTLIIEGYDEVFRLVYPGGHSERFVRVLANIELAQSEGVSRKLVHVTEVERRSA